LNQNWRIHKRATTVTSIKKPRPYGSLSQNHPFIDGNKRVAITTTAAFLRVYVLNFNDREAYGFLIDLYNTGEFRMTNLEQWIREHARRSLLTLNLL
jgi:prophage maintenance system killer protein